MTSTQDQPATGQAPAGDGSIIQAFATPVARATFPLAEQLNEQFVGIVLGKLTEVDNKFTFKAETSADMTRWGEPLIDRLTAWVLNMARDYVQTVTGQPLGDLYAQATAADQETVNSGPAEGTRSLSIVAARSWASVYRAGDRHDAHFHPNTAIAAIYYVQAPDVCELDLLDPRSGIDYFDPGLQFAGEGRNLRLRCQPGELVLFPGWLKHAVPPFHGDGLRISLSWNLGYLTRTATPQTTRESQTSASPG